MIRVNLISTAPGQVVAAAPARNWFPKEQRSAAMGLALLLFTAIGVTSWWWYLHMEKRSVERGIVEAELELQRLKEVAVLVDKATARKAELAERLDLIERLRATMRAPVRLLETVSKSVPYGLWLLEVKQTGQSVQMDGRAMTLTPVTDFAKVMQESGFFQMPVEIISTTSEIFEEVPVIRFVMKADVINGGISPLKPTTVITDAGRPAVGTPVTAPPASMPATPTTATIPPPVIATGGVGRSGGR
jgi:type IV pilus assembly protein PilN